MNKIRPKNTAHYYLDKVTRDPRFRDDRLSTRNLQLDVGIYR